MALKDTLRRWYSFIAEIPVRTYESEISPSLKISYYKGRYVLGTGDIMYSFEDEYTAFKEAFSQVKPEKRGIEKVLILGYGLGSIPAILNKRHKMNCEYTAVELDPMVITLAKEYSEFPKKSSIRLHCGDAYEYVQTAQEQFDLIVVDLFIVDNVPNQFSNDEFITNLRRLMAPKGMVMFNRLYSNTAQRIATDGFFQYTFHKEFPEAYAIDTGGNLVLVFDDRTKKIRGMQRDQPRS
jgi:spermidine synthase